MRLMSILIFSSAMLAPFANASSPPLVVHEWGTFTSLQDETGRTIGGINTDDEPLPKFVHDLLQGTTEIPDGKGLPFSGSRREITMRLETPVIYFHLPPGSAQQSVDVSVQFLGGVLSQFYPDAKSNFANRKLFPAIDENTLSTLSWPSVRVGTNVTGPATNEHVWLAPRRSTPRTSPRPMARVSGICSIAALDTSTRRFSQSAMEPASPSRSPNAIECSTASPGASQSSGSRNSILMDRVTPSNSGRWMKPAPSQRRFRLCRPSIT